MPEIKVYCIIIYFLINTFSTFFNITGLLLICEGLSEEIKSKVTGFRRI